MAKEQRNLYPLWWLISDEAKILLWKYQEETYGMNIDLPPNSIPEVAIDYGKEMAKPPSRSRG
jgi:hypothetical protein